MGILGDYKGHLIPIGDCVLLTALTSLWEALAKKDGATERERERREREREIQIDRGGETWSNRF